MSVLACGRRGCENIMCDRVSDIHGYICHECFEDLVDSCTTDIAIFMDTRKRENCRLDLREVYSKEFPMTTV